MNQNNPFRKATKEQAKLRLALEGVSGAGKTYTALLLAAQLGDQVAVIDTERGSAAKYADQFAFDTLTLTDFHPKHYIDAIAAAVSYGYNVVVIDSLSHAWSGKGGALELVDNATARSTSKNSYFAWKDVTPLHNALIDAITGANAHVIATMRSKTEYVVEKRDGKDVPRKVGMAAIQRDGMEYEFDIVGTMDVDHNMIIAKSRCPALADAVIARPDYRLADTIKTWLTDGAAPHWAKNGGGEKFVARMKELGLNSTDVLANLEPDLLLERLSDTTLTFEEAMARLDEMANGGHDGSLR